MIYCNINSHHTFNAINNVATMLTLTETNLDATSKSDVSVKLEKLAAVAIAFTTDSFQVEKRL